MGQVNMFDNLNLYKPEENFINTKERLEEHLKLIISLFDKLYEQSVTILYKNNKLRLQEELDNLSSLRTLVSSNID